MKKAKNIFWLLLAAVAVGVALLPWLFVILAVFNLTDWGPIIVLGCYGLSVLVLTVTVLLKNVPNLDAVPIWLKIIIILIVLISIVLMEAF